MRFVISHLPHLLPAVVAVAFLFRYGLGIAPEPPPDLAPDQLEEWRRAQAQRALDRRVRRRTAQLGLVTLVPLAAAVGTGGYLYAVALADDRPSAALTWSHGVLSTIALALVTWKVAEGGIARLRRGLDPRRALGEGVSLLAAVLGAPLVVTGAVLLAQPSSGSWWAYLHLMATAWWAVLVGAHLARYLGRSVDAALRGAAAPEPASETQAPRRSPPDGVPLTRSR
jgi:hypothetical protein